MLRVLHVKCSRALTQTRHEPLNLQTKPGQPHPKDLKALERKSDLLERDKALGSGRDPSGG